MEIQVIRKSGVLAFIALMILGLSCQSAGDSKILAPRKMQVLFLGHDSEHHNSEAYAPMLASALAPKGVSFSYSSDPRSLNNDNLEKFDAVLLYANHDEITDAQDRALQKYVKGGGAFLPIHSASYCFRNSDDFVKMVGAQFASHDTAVFTAEIIQPEHEIMQGFSPFETWDETYVHSKHSRGRDILMERVQDGNKEPWTWTKKHGKGRVFYTAYGHDERTWSQPAFHDLIFRGLQWAVGKQKSDALAGVNLPILTHTEAKIPNYEKRDPPPRFQAPLSPEESQQHIQVGPDFKLELFAAEPDIINPISMNWDERGRLWILETVDYPNLIKREEGEGRDRIKILEDTDGDGKADKFTVFAENLSVPTSLVFYQGGVIVSQSPQFLFLKDTDGDDIADERSVIIEGWGSYDTHASASNLRYGFDNQIWGVLGYSGFDGAVGGEQLKFAQGLYRFKPDGSKLEYMSKSSNNTWGLGFSETFDIFISTANNTHSGYFGIPDSHLKDAEGLTFSGIQKIDGHYHFHPITENFRQVDVFGGFTAAAGHALYTARAFPKEYWNSAALVCEPTGHLLHHAIIEKDGAGFAEKDGWNILASHDEWVSPVCAEVGPDGAVWIADWYNFIIQHNPTPEGFDNGEGNAHINPLRDKQHGRIYRVSYRDAPKVDPIKLDKNNQEQLLATLASDNLFWRLHAQRLLVESNAENLRDPLLALVSDESEDALGLNPKALHAIWTLHGLGLIESDSMVREEIYTALQHPVAGVRKAAIQALPPDGRTMVELAHANVFFDRDMHTRLAAVNLLYELPTNQDLGEIILDLSDDAEVKEDLWLSRATYLAAIKHQDVFVAALVKNDPTLFDRSVQDVDQEKVDYADPALDVTGWYDTEAPAWWGNDDLDAFTGFDGIAWYRRSIELTAKQAAQKSQLYLAKVADSDVTYFNGKRIGAGKGWNKERIYRIPRGLLKEGKNVIAVQVTDNGGGGGIWGDPEELYLENGDEQIALAGSWKITIEKVVTSAVSPFQTGETVQSLFLKNYGPKAREQAAAMEKESALVDHSFTVRTVRDQMQYDLTRLEATAGSTIEIVFINDDAMQHNMLVLAPGTLHTVGEAAEAFAKTPNAAERGYRPAMPEILAGTPLVNPGESHTFRFKAGDRPGEYPFVCTFPGHYKTMNGVLVLKGEVK